MVIKIAVIVLILNFAVPGLVGSQIQDAKIKINLDRVIPSAENNSGFDQDDQIIQVLQEDSIFSQATLISLLFVFVGIVAFRRNTY